MVQALSLLPRIADLRIVVVGDVMLDVYEYCRSAHSKELPSEAPGQRAYRNIEVVEAIGGAGNVAANLAALGATADLVAVTGADPHGRTLEALCSRAGIGGRRIADDARPTTTKARIYVDGRYLLRRDYENQAPVADPVEAALLEEAASRLAGADALVLSDYVKGCLTKAGVRTLIEAAAEAAVPVVVDCKPPHADWFEGADIVAPNDLEADELTPGFMKSLDKRRYVEQLHARFGCATTVVTLGANGICGFDGSRFHYQEAHDVEAVDPVGAGDTVRAALAIGRALDCPLPGLLAFANDIAAVSVAKPGTAIVSPADIIDFANRGRTHSSDGGSA